MLNSLVFQGLRVPDTKGDGSGETRLRLFGFAWCQDIVKQVNDWDSDSLIGLLSAGMLKIESKERDSAAKCLMRVKDFESSVDPTFHPGSITPTPRASLIGGDDRDSTIIKGPLRVSGVALGDEGSCGLQLGAPGNAPLHLYTLSKEHSEFINKSSPLHTMYDAVLALLNDLLPTGGANQNVDDDASAMVRRLCEYLTSLNIAKMAVHQEQPYITIIITTSSNNKEMVLANLISSELMISIEVLAGHLFHKLQFQILQPRRRIPVHHRHLQSIY